MQLNYTITSHHHQKAITRPLLVLVHGMTSATFTFSGVTADLMKETNCDIVSVDLRGHGASKDSPTGLKGYNLDAMADDLKTTLDTIRANSEDKNAAQQKVHLLGHSWGSRVVMQYLKKFPNDVRSVISEDEHMDPQPLPHDEKTEELALAKAQQALDAYPEEGLFDTAEHAIEYSKHAMGPHHDIAYDRKVMAVKTTSGDGEPTTKAKLLFKPHVALMWNYYCSVADFNDIWLKQHPNRDKETGDHPTHDVPILVLKAGSEETADIKMDTFMRMQGEAAKVAELHPKGGLRLVEQITGSDHGIHRTHPLEFVIKIGGFLKHLH